jgi:hypothetical protein
MPLRCHGVRAGRSLVFVGDLGMIRDRTARPIISGGRVLLRTEVRSGRSLVLVCHLDMIGAVERCRSPPRRPAGRT